MNKKYSILRRYIREAIDLGNIQFSPDRIGNVDKSEPNTPEEETLYRALINRVEGEKDLDPAAASKLKDLISSEKYGTSGSGFFSGPTTSGLLYRGQVYPRWWAAENNIDIAAVPKLRLPGPGRGMSSDFYSFNQVFESMEPIALNPPYVYGPNEDEGFRGWTPDFTVARKFAWNYAKTGDWNRAVYAVILVLDPKRQPPDALLDFSRSVYQTARGKSYDDEEEIMNLAPVQCHAAYVIDLKPSLNLPEERT